MAHILHYNEIDGSKEYIVITEDEVADELKENFRRIGFEFFKSYEIDGDLGSLPLDRELEPRL